MGTWLAAKEVAAQVREEAAAQVKVWRADGVVPKAAALVAGEDPASLYYADAKRKLASKLGFEFELRTVPASISQEELIAIVKEWNADPELHGMMLELPLPASISLSAVVSVIDPLKDVDGLSPANRLAVMTGEPGLYPATPQSCIRLLKHYGYTLEGKNVTIIGRGQTVGLPLFHMLQREQATVTVCHSRTVDLRRHLERADIAIAAAGKPGLISREMMHAGLVVIDAGINELADGSITGDVSPDAVEAAAAVSTVPGGVGVLTTAMLFANVIKAIRLQQRFE